MCSGRRMLYTTGWCWDGREGEANFAETGLAFLATHYSHTSTSSSPRSRLPLRQQLSFSNFASRNLSSSHPRFHLTFTNSEIVRSGCQEHNLQRSEKSLQHQQCHTILQGCQAPFPCHTSDVAQALGGAVPGMSRFRNYDHVLPRLHRFVISRRLF